MSAVTDEAIPDEAIPDYATRHRMDGEVAVVVGAGQGIGRQSSHALAALGATVLCVDIDPGRADEIATAVGGVPLVADATERDGVREMVAVATAMEGRLGAVVDIIGAAIFSEITSTTDEQWDRSFRLNFRHAALLVELAGPALARAGGGSMVFISSISGLQSSRKFGSYGAAKAALHSLVQTASEELGPSGVRLNAVAPGVVWTPRMAELLGDEGRRTWSENTPTRSVAMPSDIASSAAFLASPAARYITGQILVVDGGVGRKFPHHIETITG